LPFLRNKQYVTRILSQSFTFSLVLVLTALLRFYRLSGQSLWADEGNSVALARRGFVEIARRTAFDIHPPLYYWLLKIWIAIFGDSEIGLRSLSAVLGVGVVYLIWLLGSRLFSRRVGLIATFIVAISPLQV
jgi:mannosyltransferase